MPRPRLGPFAVQAAHTLRFTAGPPLPIPVTPASDCGQAIRSGRRVVGDIGGGPGFQSPPPHKTRKDSSGWRSIYRVEGIRHAARPPCDLARVESRSIGGCEVAGRWAAFGTAAARQTCAHSDPTQVSRAARTSLYLRKWRVDRTPIPRRASEIGILRATGLHPPQQKIAPATPHGERIELTGGVQCRSDPPASLHSQPLTPAGCVREASQAHQKRRLRRGVCDGDIKMLANHHRWCTCLTPVAKADSCRSLWCQRNQNGLTEG